MTDVSHIWGSDLQWSATGDLLTVSGTQEGRQRVLRRLLTNLKEYIWDLSYGAGLPGKIGLTPTTAEIRANVLSQMLLEAAVAQDPPPTVVATPLISGTPGFAIDIQYTDVAAGTPVFLNFSVGGGS